MKKFLFAAVALVMMSCDCLETEKQTPPATENVEIGVVFRATMIHGSYGNAVYKSVVFQNGKTAVFEAGKNPLVANLMPRDTVAFRRLPFRVGFQDATILNVQYSIPE